MVLLGGVPSVAQRRAPAQSSRSPAAAAARPFGVPQEYACVSEFAFFFAIHIWICIDKKNLQQLAWTMEYSCTLLLGQIHFSVYMKKYILYVGACLTSSRTHVCDNIAIKPVRLAGSFRCWIVKKYCWLVCVREKYCFGWKFTIVYDKPQPNKQADSLYTFANQKVICIGADSREEGRLIILFSISIHNI